MIQKTLDLAVIFFMTIAILYKPKWFSVIAGLSAVELGAVAVFNNAYPLAFAHFNAALAWLAVLLLERKYDPYASKE